MTLQEVVQCIQESQQLAESDPAAALQKNRALFLALICQDKAYLVPEAEVSSEALEQKLFRPYIAPAQEGDPRLFLRVFSHEEPALSFSEQQGHGQICAIDGVELAQLAKTYFLRGAYGFLLNDGSVWTAISFPEFLTTFYKEILGDESLARPEFIALIQFINMVRQNYAYHIQVGRQTVRDAGSPIQTRFIDRPNNIWTAEPGDWLYEECRLEHLMQACGDSGDAVVFIKTSKCDLKIQPAYLRAALCAAGLVDRRTQPDLNFHTDAIALDYRIQDFDLDRVPLQCQLAELPKLEKTKEEESSVDEIQPHTEKKLPKFFTDLLSKWKALKKASEPVEDVLDVPEKEKEEPVVKADKKPLRLDSKLMIKGFLAAACLLVLIAFMGQLFKPSPRDNLEEAIANGDAAQTVTFYEECIDRDPDSREELLQILASDLVTSLDQYAADEITANQLADKISSYEEIPELRTKCSSVYDQASALEQSKTAFNDGLIETSMVGRLTAWQRVIDADTGSKVAMKSALEENSDIYKVLVFEEVEEMDRGAALSALMLLQSYYPNDKDVAEGIQAWRKETASQEIPSSVGNPPSDSDSETDWPISVGDIYVESNQHGGYDLYIPWQNKSGESITGLLFTVTALDKNGNPVFSTTKNENGEEITYHQYIADAGSGPYPDGFIMPDNAYWPSAWVTNSSISSVRLDGIWVQYEDKSKDSWTYTRTPEESSNSTENTDEHPVS